MAASLPHGVRDRRGHMDAESAVERPDLVQLV
jgi:hypothetical protein